MLIFALKNSMKAVRIISAFLGFSMFTFGILKFVNPFKGWYSVQIMNSGLNGYLYWLGILGEISAGILFLGIVLFRNKLSKKVFSLTIILASALVIMMMVTAIRTHLHPNVPADVLPLKIKPPFIPGFLLVLAIADIFLIRRVVLRNDRYNLPPQAV
jgi:hypothetical protein